MLFKNSLFGRMCNNFFDLEINLTTNKLKINYFNINEFNLDDKDSVKEILQNYIKKYSGASDKIIKGIGLWYYY